MKLTHKLADDMAAMHDSIVKVYIEELCDRVEKGAIIKLKRSIYSLKHDLDTLENRIGMELYADLYSKKLDD